MTRRDQDVFDYAIFIGEAMDQDRVEKRQQISLELSRPISWVVTVAILSPSEHMRSTDPFCIY